MANKQAILGSGARFTGKISNAKSIEINGYVEADVWYVYWKSVWSSY